MTYETTLNVSFNTQLKWTLSFYHVFKVAQNLSHHHKSKETNGTFLTNLIVVIQFIIGPLTENNHVPNDRHFPWTMKLSEAHMLFCQTCYKYSAISNDFRCKINVTMVILSRRAPFTRKNIFIIKVFRKIIRAPLSENWTFRTDFMY